MQTPYSPRLEWPKSSPWARRWEPDKCVGEHEFSCTMRNVVRLSNHRKPSVPLIEGPEERLLVELEDDLLKISHLRSGGRTDACLYALRTLAFRHAATFMFLARPPRRTVDQRFFAAEGTAFVFLAADGRRRLRACGADRNAGSPQGWIFDAVEISSAPDESYSAPRLSSGAAQRG
jgi:hypothetical protein